jgi:hypothetical protein
MQFLRQEVDARLSGTYLHHRLSSPQGQVVEKEHERVDKLSVPIVLILCNRKPQKLDWIFGKMESDS